MKKKKTKDNKDNKNIKDIKDIKNLTSVTFSKLSLAEKYKLFIEWWIPNKIYRTKPKTNNLWPGGRGTGTSEGITRRALEKALRERCSILVVRQNGASHNKSTWKLFNKRTVEIDPYAKFNKSEKEITMTNGSSIYFIGLNDVERIKSIAAELPIGFVMFEEVTEMKRWEDIITTMDSARGHEKVEFHFLYNTTKPNHWIKIVEENYKKYFTTPTQVIRTTIFDNKFNTNEFIARQLALKDINIKEYNVRVLGLWEALGDLTYNFKEEFITPQVRNFYNLISIGIDVGDVNATTAIAVGYADNWNTIDVLDEYYHANKDSDNKKTQNDYAKDIKEFIDSIKRKFATHKISIQVESAMGGGGLLLALQNIGVNRNNNYDIELVNKNVKIEDRVIATNFMFDVGRVNFFDRCKNLISEIKTSMRDLNAKDSRYFRKDENDHAINAWEYAMLKYWKYFAIEVTPQDLENKVRIKWT